MRRNYLAILKKSKKIISLSYSGLWQFAKFFSPIFAQNAQVCARVEGLFFMNNKLYVDLICSCPALTLVSAVMKAVLARIFGSSARLLSFFLMNNELFPILARKMLQKCYKSKTNPKRTQTNPIFRRTNPILNPKMRIFDKFRKYFLCKTNPICSLKTEDCCKRGMSDLLQGLCFYLIDFLSGLRMKFRLETCKQLRKLSYLKVRLTFFTVRLSNPDK